MTVSFADQFDIPQFSKKYSVILKGKRLRGCVLTYSQQSRAFVHGSPASVLADVAQPANGCVSGI